MNAPSSPATYDLLIRAGRVVCPATGFDGPAAVAIRGDRIVEIGKDITGNSRQMIEYPAAVLLPGLIDLHAHPAKSGSMFGVDPDCHLLARGTTTVLSQGDAWASNFESYLRNTIEPSRTEILVAINLSSAGEVGPDGCFERPELIDVGACVSAIEKYRRHIWGIAVNVSHNCCGTTDPREVLDRGLIVAEATGLPLLYGMRRPEDWPLEDQLRLLRPGDVVTYCFRRTPHCIVQNGRVLSCVRAARERGILFDVGHGRGSFDFVTAEAALGDGFAPDSISTDLQQGHVGQPPTHDLPLVMSKLRAAGMTEHDVFAAVTSKPAEVLRQSHEIGSLKIGSRADLTLLRWIGESTSLVDVHGNERCCGRWDTIATIRAGRLIESVPSS